ncbi:MAG: hypothetical protein DRR08_01820 [Candidatus Parabeggiatoa sp. nov. 2]|nr:MAG: hypothetical protein B6247_04645 [Beggiatoa sp. 4572_84]RKZ64021.1 MAG: hypothetical protein DRR08_01820 [Gammaproteobacteria bacterium]HEC86178.1 hypothetical protein [Thioploca sp.]
MKTIREQILERITAQLETITNANGYHNDIGPGCIYRQESVIEQGQSPAISVWELSETRERNKYGGTKRVLTIKIEAVVPVNGNKHPATVSNELLGDIEKALIMGDMSLDELIDDIQDIAAEISSQPISRKLASVAQNNGTAEIAHLPIERKLAGATLDFEIKYTTEWGDPYTQSM